MAIQDPPVIPEITTPVAQRTDPQNFSVLHDRFLREMPVTVDGINVAVTWTHQTALATQQLKNAAAQSAINAANQVTLASNQADRAYNEAERSKTEAGKSASSADTAEAAALVAQDAAGIPADYTGLAGMPLSVNPSETGTHFADPIFPFKPITAHYTAKAGDVLAVDATSSVINITLPASPVHRAKISIFDRTGNWGSKPPLLKRNGKNIVGLAEDMHLNVPFASILVVYDQTKGWTVI